MNLASHLVAWGLALSLFLGIAVGWLVIPHAPHLDPLVLVVLWFNIALVLVGLGFELGRRPYSLHAMHLISLFLFLGAASLLQYSAGRFGVAGPISTVRGQILSAASAATLWIVAYLVTYEARRLVGTGGSRGVVSRFLTRPITNARAFLLAVLALLGLGYLGAVGLLGAETRGAAEMAMEEFAFGSGLGSFSNVLYVVNYNLMRALPVVALLAVSLVLARGRGRSGGTPLAFTLPFLAIGTLALNNPFAASRMFLTCTIIGFAAPFLLRRMRTGWALLVAVMAGLSLLPALSATRITLDLAEFRTYYFVLASPLQYLASNSDVDSLGMTALCQKWVEQHGHRWGRQIAGALLAWIPRALWRDKPIATGSMVTADLGFDFTNLSPPISAEALVDFGLLGVPVFAALFALILARLDATYWSPGRESLAGGARVIDAIYSFWLVCVVHFTRGDLFAASTFTWGFTLWIFPLGLRLMSLQRAPTGSGAGVEQARELRDIRP